MLKQMNLEQDSFVNATDIEYAKYMKTQRHLVNYPSSEVIIIDELLKKVDIILDCMTRHDSVNGEPAFHEFENYLSSDILSNAFVKYICTALLNLMFMHMRQNNYLQIDLINFMKDTECMDNKREIIGFARHYFYFYLNCAQIKNEDYKNSGYVRYVKEYVYQHYVEDISFSKLAYTLHISRNYLSYLFKKETGYCFMDYLTKFRIEKAKELMKNRHLLMCEISQKVGYQDPAYFSRIFKNITGKSPTAFQNGLFE